MRTSETLQRIQLITLSSYFTFRDPIDTIPEAIWWAIITVTTVGYGDAIPLSFGGKILSLFALLFGVIVSDFSSSLY